MMGHISHNSPPNPWGTGETKKTIVGALKNENSDMHLYTGDISATGCAKVNYAKIRELYAPKHEMKNFCPNLKRMIEYKMMKTGPFMVPAKNNESLSPWYTSSKKTSLAYTLLHDMYRFNSIKINRIQAEDIWKSHPQFQQYPLEDFKRYNKNMKNLDKMQRKCMRQ